MDVPNVGPSNLSVQVGDEAQPLVDPQQQLMREIWNNSCPQRVDSCDYALEVAIKQGCVGTILPLAYCCSWMYGCCENEVEVVELMHLNHGQPVKMQKDPSCFSGLHCIGQQLCCPVTYLMLCGQCGLLVCSGCCVNSQVTVPRLLDCTRAWTRMVTCCFLT